MSIDRGMNKEDVVHIYNGILPSHLKEWNNAICSNMNGPRECHTEWSKSDREGEIYNIAYMWNLKNGTNEPVYLQNKNWVKNSTNVENKFIVSKRGKDKLGDWDWHIHNTVYKKGN